MIYNTAKRTEKFEETWVLNESPDWRNFCNTFDSVGLESIVSVKFISNNTEFDSIKAAYD